MSMDDYSKAVEETKMVPNVSKDRMHVIGLEGIKYRKERKCHRIEKWQISVLKKQIQTVFDSQ